ncbi:MAG TPA: DUF4388 domain-containing protein [Thermoanaerobaculia bacterium]|nr:DUF4388 domain-containing protein [Thermoanaerobaculia bacterium]
MLPEETSPEVREALEELHLYLSDVLPPLVVAESFKLLLRYPPALMATNIESWTAVQHRSGSGLKASDYFFYAIKKVYLIGEFRLVTRGPFAAFLADLMRLVVASCPAEEREALRRNLERLSEATDATLTASVDSLIRGKGWQPGAAPQGLPLTADELGQLRRFSILLERFDARAGTPQAESVRSTELLAHALAMAARSSHSSEEFEKNLQKLGLQMETGQVFRALAAGLPGWPPPPPAPEGSEGEKAAPVPESAPLAAMHRIVEQPEEPGEVARRFNEMVKTACERFNEGALPQAVTMLDLAERIVKEKRVDAAIVEAVRQKADESLDVERLRRYAEIPRLHPLLRRVLNFFVATRPPGLLAELLRETKRERRKLILQLLEVHGAPSRQQVLARLQSAFGKGEGDEKWYFRRNLLYLLRRIPASGQGGLPPEEDVDVASRHAVLQFPAALVKEAVANLGLLRHEKAQKKLIQLLDELEKMLIKPGPAPPYDTREGRLLLERVVSALARFGTPEARRAVVEHALKKKPELGDTMARLSELAGQDLSADGESLEALLTALKANTPRRVFGIVLSQNESNVKHIVEALSTTPSEMVREAFKSLARKFAGLEIGKAATRALATIDSAGQIPEAPYDGRSGEIEIFGLPALVQGLADSGASGLLKLKDPRGEMDGEILLRAGRMKGCEARGLSGEEAFYQLLERPSPASYVFERLAADAKPESSAGNLPEFAPLCLEGMRRHDEFSQATVVVPDDARLSKTQVRPEHHPDELDGMFVNGLWNLIAGGATPTDCEGALKADSFRIRRQLVHWVETGALAIA